MEKKREKERELQSERGKLDPFHLQEMGAL